MFSMLYEYRTKSIFYIRLFFKNKTRGYIIHLFQSKKSFFICKSILLTLQFCNFYSCQGLFSSSITYISCIMSPIQKATLDYYKNN